MIKVKPCQNSAFYSILTKIDKSVLPSKIGIIRNPNESEILSLSFIF